MATNLRDKMKSVGSKRRKKIEARVMELVAEELALRELRKAHHRTQASMAKQLGITQDGVSRLEKRSDLLLSTLRSYVEAMHGLCIPCHTEQKLKVQKPDLDQCKTCHSEALENSAAPFDKEDIDRLPERSVTAG